MKDGIDPCIVESGKNALVGEVSLDQPPGLGGGAPGQRDNLVVCRKNRKQA